MTVINLSVTGAQAQASTQGLLTGGMAGVPVVIGYDSAWDALTKTAVFRAGGITVDRVDIGSRVTVPAQVLQKQNCTLQIGIYGTNRDGSVVIPTVWAQVGTILPGADPSGDEGADPALPVWQQLLQMQQDQAAKTAQSMGNIEAALDGILSIQQELIGGENG